MLSLRVRALALHVCTSYGQCNNAITENYQLRSIINFHWDKDVLKSKHTTYKQKVWKIFMTMYYNNVLLENKFYLLSMCKYLQKFSWVDINSCVYGNKISQIAIKFYFFHKIWICLDWDSLPTWLPRQLTWHSSRNKHLYFNVYIWMSKQMLGFDKNDL